MKPRIIHADKVPLRADWKPYWFVSLEWLGNKPQVLPLIEYAVKENSDGSGCCLLDGVCDADWNADKAWKARRVFIRLRSLCASTRFAPFIRLRLLHYEQQTCRPRLIESFRRGKAPVIPMRKMRKRRAA